ncbi:MAG: siphovirus Gp157 family protein [Rickettsiales bacterium]
MNLTEIKANELAAKINVSQITINDLDGQIKDFQAAKKKLEEELRSFKDELREAMAESGTTRIESKEYGILFRLDAPSVSVKINDESLIDDKFFRVKREADKTAIKKALQVGDAVEGAELVEGKHRLTIKV